MLGRKAYFSERLARRPPRRWPATNAAASAKRKRFSEAWLARPQPRKRPPTRSPDRLSLEGGLIAVDRAENGQKLHGKRPRWHETSQPADGRRPSVGTMRSR